MHKKLWLILIVTNWTVFFVVSGLIYYVGHYLPHGISYPTGENSCDYSSRGPCREIYKEDLRGINIPNWAKFFRESEVELLWIALLFIGIITSDKIKKN